MSEKKSGSFENVIKVVTIIAALVALFFTANAAISAKKSAEIARESVDVLKENFELENRPYVHITFPQEKCNDKGGCADRTSLWFDFDYEKCSTTLMYDRLNAGKYPAIIKNEVISGFRAKDDISRMGEKLVLFPGKRMSNKIVIITDLTDGRCVKPKERIVNVKIDYTSVFDESVPYTYVAKIKATFTIEKNGSIGVSQEVISEY